MRIIIDAMGGDNAPDEIVKATVAVKDELSDVEMVLVGRIDEIRNSAEKHGLSLDGISLENADEVVTMEDDPSAAFREKKNSSLSVGLSILKENGDAFLSAGNTGALVFSSTFTVRRLPGVERPCLAAVLPFENPVMILDSGANLEVKPEFMEQWAVVGSIYYKKLFGVDSPRIGLLNNGAEETKGTALQKEAYALLSATENINFVGNIEGRYVPSGTCDVLLCDGFTGNILLKFTEGIAKMFMGTLKDTLYKSSKNKIAGLLMKNDLNGIKEKFNYKNYGCAPVVGLSKPVFKAHGNSDALSFSNAIRQAVSFVKGDTESEIKAASEYLKQLKNERKKQNV